MPLLSQISEDDSLRVIAMPYQAAMWVSHADDVDGEADDIREMKALERGVPELAKQHEESALVRLVAMEIMRNKNHWAEWEENCFHITLHAPDIMEMVLSEYGEAEAKQYRAFILELGKMVAQAASEFDGFNPIEDEQEKESFFSGIINKITGSYAAMGQDDVGHPANISAAEKGALSELAAALALA
jgi:hypothetical protein